MIYLSPAPLLHACIVAILMNKVDFFVSPLFIVCRKTSAIRGEVECAPLLRGKGAIPGESFALFKVLYHGMCEKFYAY